MAFPSSLYSTNHHGLVVVSGIVVVVVGTGVVVVVVVVTGAKLSENNIYFPKHRFLTATLILWDNLT